MILFFFVMGLAVWQHKVDHELLENRGLALTLALVVVGFAKVYLYFAHETNTLDLPIYLANFTDVAMRMTATLWFWWATGIICETKFTHFIKKFEPFIFIVFCSHIILFKIMSLIGNGVVGGYGSDWYVLYYFSQPVLAMVFGYAIFRVGLVISPPLLGILNGKETRSAA